LAAICKIFCEDYAQRGSGVPDLFIWNAKKGSCKFVEVKGPGDTLQENQKIWIDVLLNAGVSVEVCKVVEHGKTPKKGHAKTAKNKSKGKPLTRKVVVESAVEETSPVELRGTKRRRVDDELPAINLPLSQTKDVNSVITTSPPTKRRLT